MHSVKILLTKANDKSEALSKVISFLEKYAENVFDWYAIGGRWNNTLAPLMEEFTKQATTLCSKEGDPFISQQSVDNQQDRLQQIWESLGMKGLNPWCNHYELPESGNTYDVIPLSQCVERVKTYIVDTDALLKETWNKMLQAHEEKGTMDAYYANKYSNIKYQNFNFETGVFNIDNDTAERLPEDVTGYFAIVVDLHN